MEKKKNSCRCAKFLIDMCKIKVFSYKVTRKTLRLNAAFSAKWYKNNMFALTEQEQ